MIFPGKSVALGESNNNNSVAVYRRVFIAVSLTNIDAGM
jgi:hypothetical protein